MGMYDRDWYRDHHRKLRDEEEAKKRPNKNNGLYNFKAEFERLERKRKKKKTDWGIMFFWLATLGTLTALMSYLLKLKL